MEENLVCDDLMAKACKHCVALFICENKHPIQVKVSDPNATMTFIQYSGNVYGVTCKHVVELLRRKQRERNDPESYTFVTITNGTHLVPDRFVFPQSDFSFIHSSWDVALLKVSPDYPSSIKKTPIMLEKSKVLPLREDLLGVAVGFPKQLKRRDTDGILSRIAMPCVCAAAKVVSVADSKIQLYSDIKGSPDATDFNGMSGGPVFWNATDKYGLLGIMYQAMPIQPRNAEKGMTLGGKPKIFINAVPITPHRFGQWVANFDQLPDR